jgi:flagellar biosynthesis chaperone FliJ
MHDHEKLQKILDIRKRREDKALKKYYKKRQELENYETKLQEERTKIEQFMQKRTVDLQTIQNRIRTEAVSGLVFDQYLQLKDDTEKKIKEMYGKLDEKSQAYYPILDEVNELFREWEDIKKGQTKLEQVVTQKTEEFTFEKNQEIDKKMSDDFVFRPRK